MNIIYIENIEEIKIRNENRKQSAKYERSETWNFSQQIVKGEHSICKKHAIRENIACMAYLIFHLYQAKWNLLTHQ